MLQKYEKSLSKRLKISIFFNDETIKKASVTNQNVV